MTEMDSGWSSYWYSYNAGEMLLPFSHRVGEVEMFTCAFDRI